MHARVSRLIEEVLRINREEDNLDGLRICQGCVEQTESTRFWLGGSTYLSRSCQGQTQISRQKRYLSKSYQGCKKEVFQRGKTHKMRKQQDGYLNKYPSNMLSTQITPQLQMQSIPRSTNTLNKSNQFYISKTS